MTIKKIKDEVTPSIRNIIKAISQSGRTQVLQSAGREFLRETKANFGKSGAYRDKPWAKLSPAYSQKVHRNYATEQVSGKLKASIQLGQSRGNYIEIYTRNVYAAAQAFGYKPRHLPARNFFPIENVGGPTYNRLVFKSQRDLYKVISSRLTILSSGALPIQGTLMNRAPLTYGNPFTGI